MFNFSPYLLITIFLMKNINSSGQKCCTSNWNGQTRWMAVLTYKMAEGMIVPCIFNNIFFNINIFNSAETSGEILNLHITLGMAPHYFRLSLCNSALKKPKLYYCKFSCSYHHSIFLLKLLLKFFFSFEQALGRHILS